MSQSIVVNISELRNSAAQLPLKYNKCTFWFAAEVFHIPKSTLDNRLTPRRNPLPQRSRTVLCAHEQDMVVQGLLQYSERGVRFTRTHLVEAVEYMIQLLPKIRRQALPFQDGSPGIKWVRAFEKRHQKRVSLGHTTDDV